MDIWTNNKINYDIIVYSKQSKHEQFINACTLNIQKIIKYKIDVDKFNKFEKMFQPYEEIIYLYDNIGNNLMFDSNYYITFDQNITLDLIDIKFSYSKENEYQIHILKKVLYLKSLELLILIFFELIKNTLISLL